MNLNFFFFTLEYSLKYKTPILLWKEKDIEIFYRKKGLKIAFSVRYLVDIEEALSDSSLIHYSIWAIKWLLAPHDVINFFCIWNTKKNINKRKTREINRTDSAVKDVSDSGLSFRERTGSNCQFWRSTGYGEMDWWWNFSQTRNVSGICLKIFDFLFLNLVLP